jgi:hypothetical protein
MDYPTINNPGSTVFCHPGFCLSVLFSKYIRVIVPFHFSASSLFVAPRSVFSPSTVHEYFFSVRCFSAFLVSPHSAHLPESSDTFSPILVPVHPILSEPVELSLILLFHFIESLLQTHDLSFLFFRRRAFPSTNISR